MHTADLVHGNPSIQDKLEEIYALRRTRSKVNWDRNNFLKLLDDFGNPHLSLPPVIHVGGTNGKGSVIAMLRSILEAGGYRVHVYTSPHLIEVNERIVLAGEQIADETLSDLIDQALIYADGAPLSFFEIMTALAFRAFADTAADVLLLEVGMGGRLDCTNVVPNKLACVINRISLDHTEFLGSTLEEIAAEKAGIVQEGVPCFIGAQDAAAMSVLQKKASDAGADIVDGWSVDHMHEACDDDYMRFRFYDQSYNFPVPSLQGAHQIQNAGLALATIFALRDALPVSRDVIEAGLQNVRWLGRLQRIESVDLGLPDTLEIWLDCGHNDSAGDALAAFAQVQGRPVYLVVGMLKGKDIQAFLEPLVPVVKGFYLVPVSGNECYVSGDVAGSVFCEDFLQALRLIAGADENACVLIAGSVYLAGDVLKRLRGFA